MQSENDHAPAAERAMAAKRADYFACGTLVVWDVDLFSEEMVKVYCVSALDHLTVSRRSDVAAAELALPGERPAVDEPVR